MTGNNSHEEAGSRLLRLVYKPWSIVAGVVGGHLAAAVFKRVWKLATGEGEPPKATDRHRNWLQSVLAVAFEGAVYSGVKALVQRGSAAGFEGATGQWPD